MAPSLDRLALQMIDFTRHIKRTLTAPDAGQKNPLSMPQFGTLMIVSELKNPLMKEVAEALRIAAPTATPMIEGMVRSGHLVRSKDKKDRRAIRLQLTAKGRATLSACMRRTSMRMKKMLTVLGDAERKQLHNILSLLTDSSRT